MHVGTPEWCSTVLTRFRENPEYNTLYIMIPGKNHAHIHYNFYKSVTSVDLCTCVHVYVVEYRW